MACRVVAALRSAAAPPLLAPLAADADLSRGLRMARSVNSTQRTTGDQPAVPSSLQELLGVFRGCFSAWTLPVFCALARGLVSETARRAVCGMLVGDRLSQTWSHHRAHRFFSHARCSSSKATPTANDNAPRATQLDGSHHAPQDDTAAARWSLGRGNALVPWSWQMTPCDLGQPCVSGPS